MAEDQRLREGGDPEEEEELLLADSVGLALLVVLGTLGPAERVAFVLHDLFAVPFDEITPVVGRSAKRGGSWRAGVRLAGGITSVGRAVRIASNALVFSQSISRPPLRG